ncbi:MAG: hypothetical protein ACREBH_03460 [Candidatus Micrarchaeaceae archaeon]
MSELMRKPIDMFKSRLNKDLETATKHWTTTEELSKLLDSNLRYITLPGTRYIKNGHKKMSEKMPVLMAIATHSNAAASDMNRLARISSEYYEYGLMLTVANNANTDSDTLTFLMNNVRVQNRLEANLRLRESVAGEVILIWVKDTYRVLINESIANHKNATDKITTRLKKYIRD